MSPVDTSLCEREPIHIPGSIQPQGVLLALETSELRLAWISANAQDVCGIDPDSVLGEPATAWLADATARSLSTCLQGASPTECTPLPVQLCNSTKGQMVGALHRSGDLLILELEPGRDVSPGEVFRDAQRTLARLQASESVQALLDTAARDVRALTGFDRVMIYRFHPDWHGEVVAESRVDEVTSFLGLHFPASDIPAQARQLYTQTWLRLIGNVDAQPVPLLGAPQWRSEPLDLGRAALRSVSPVHIEYLRNMNVAASMSISIVAEGRLWGLVSCHHRTPHWPTQEVRSVCELVGQMLSWQVVNRERSAEFEQRARTNVVLSRLVEQMSGASSFLDGMIAGDHTLLDLVQAEGAAVLSGEDLRTLGTTPPEPVLAALGGKIRTLAHGRPFSTDHAAHSFPDLQGELGGAFSGILAVPFGADGSGLILWFRPQYEHTVTWGGSPEHQVEQDRQGKLHPRRSFEAWRETVRGQSRAWTDSELRAAEDLQRALSVTVVQKANELARLTTELMEAVRARDDFLSIAAHELKTPLTSLQLGAQALARWARAHGQDVGGQRVIQQAEVVGRGLKRMGGLIDQLLDVSRISAGRLRLEYGDVDLAALTETMAGRFVDDARHAGSTITLELQKPLPVRVDALRVEQVLTNLISNAIKYGDGKPIRITLEATPGLARLRVIDQGVGIAPDEQARVFEKFERASGVRKVGGFGLGLWIVRQIVEAQAGRVSVESHPGQGSTFTVELPRMPPPEPA